MYNYRNNIDEQGQPKVKYNIDALQDRHIDELIGICRGIAFDDLVTQKEAELLLKWMNEHSAYLGEYPFNILHKNLKEMLSDNILDNDEATELLGVLKGLIGEENKAEAIVNGSSSLPLDTNLPKIIIPDNSFVFTGVFSVGTRKKCEELVCDLGGEMHKTIKKNTNYLVIGNVGSDHWVHSSFGRKIEKAVKYRDNDTGISIVSEEHWISFI
ncbi:BRCT domain-containing protein [Sulfurospirillum sp.]|nr:BRCT domain-containing protein [Sulfurospirillum sp.]